MNFVERVNIILCTYNGEKYLPVLLESLLDQTYGNIGVYIRDDQSKDGTLKILEEYEGKTRGGVSIHVVRDDLGNLGYVKNFIRTVQASGDADYYAFCDQDDYWLPDKIANAVELLSQRPKDKCLLYSCAYESRNSNLEFVSAGHVPTPLEKLDVGKSLSLFDGGWLLGFTLVFNRTLKQLAFDNSVEKMYSHDIWVQAVAAGFGGELIYDPRVGAYFRRHESATSVAESGIGKSLFNAWKYRWEEFFGGKLFGQLNSGMVSYAQLYGDKVEDPVDQKFLKAFGSECGKNRMRKLLYPHRLKQSLAVECAWRLAILLGKV